MNRRYLCGLAATNPKREGGGRLCSQMPESPKRLEKIRTTEIFNLRENRKNLIIMKMK